MAVSYNDIVKKKRHYFFTFFFSTFFVVFDGGVFFDVAFTVDVFIDFLAAVATFFGDIFLTIVCFAVCFSGVDVVSHTIKSIAVAMSNTIRVKSGFSSIAHSQKNKAHPQSKRVAHHCQDIGVHQKLSSFFLNQ